MRVYRIVIHNPPMEDGYHMTMYQDALRGPRNILVSERYAKNLVRSMNDIMAFSPSEIEMTHYRHALGRDDCIDIYFVSGVEVDTEWLMDGEYAYAGAIAEAILLRD